MIDADARSDARTRLIPATAAEVYAAICDADRIARWWGPAGFSSTIHRFEFRPGGTWTLTMHDPDGKDYPNESRFARIEPGKLLAIEHLSGHHFMLTLELEERGDSTLVRWTQTFDTVEDYAGIAQFLTTANEQNLDRLVAEVERGQRVA